MLVRDGVRLQDYAREYVSLEDRSAMNEAPAFWFSAVILTNVWIAPTGFHWTMDFGFFHW